MVDGKTQPAFTLVIKGSERQGQENLAEAVGVMLESKIPAFIVALGKTVAETGLEFHDWLAENESALRTLAQQYMED